MPSDCRLLVLHSCLIYLRPFLPLTWLWEGIWKIRILLEGPPVRCPERERGSPQSLGACGPLGALHRSPRRRPKRKSSHDGKLISRVRRSLGLGEAQTNCGVRKIKPMNLEASILPDPLYSVKGNNDSDSTKLYELSAASR